MIASAVADGSAVTDPPLWIEGGAIRRAGVLIASTPVMLIFPSTPAVQDGDRLVPLEEPRFRGRPIPELKIPPWDGWGNYDVSYNCLFIKALRFVTSTTPVINPPDRHGLHDRPLDWLRSAWPPWFELAQDWIYAWTGLVRGQRHRDDTHPIVDAAVEREGIAHPGTVGISVTVASHGPQKAASAQHLRAAFACASYSYRLPAA
jgi:hypothetical protein